MESGADDVTTSEFLMMSQCFKGTNMTIKPMGMVRRNRADFLSFLVLQTIDILSPFDI